ncbi:MAG: hypothetical protein WCG11_11400 [Methylococcaceae bacterium]
MPIFNSMFQMVLRRILVQTRRLLYGRKWRKSLSTELLDDALAEHLRFSITPECITTPQRQNF